MREAAGRPSPSVIGLLCAIGIPMSGPPRRRAGLGRPGRAERTLGSIVTKALSRLLARSMRVSTPSTSSTLDKARRRAPGKLGECRGMIGGEIGDPRLRRRSDRAQGDTPVDACACLSRSVAGFLLDDLGHRDRGRPRLLVPPW